MDLHETTPGARQRATAVQDPSDSLVPGLGSLSTAAASRVRATASPGAPAVLMSTPAAFTQHPHGEGGEALSRPPASHKYRLPVLVSDRHVTCDVSERTLQAELIN